MLFRSLEAALKQSLTSLSVIGMAKNAGKTVTLNHLIDDCYREGVAIGLTSIGRDGERLDLVTKTDKPTIYVYEGTWIATAESLFDAGTARLEIQCITDFHSAMGRIVIAKVRSDGFVQLAGPSTTQGIAQLVHQLKQMGAQLVLVDGALDRTSLASPTVTDATVLATGAVISRNMNLVISETLHKVMLFKTLGCQEKLVSIGQHCRQQRLVAWVSEKAIESVSSVSGVSGEEILWLDIPTVLGAGKRLANFVPRDAVGTLLLPGSLVEQTLVDFLETRGTFKGITWVVEDATKVFISPSNYLKFVHKGFALQVVSPMTLLGVTVNPVAPQGYAFRPDEFLEQMRQSLGSVEVFDVFREETEWSY